MQLTLRVCARFDTVEACRERFISLQNMAFVLWSTSVFVSHPFGWLSISWRRSTPLFVLAQLGQRCTLFHSAYSNAELGGRLLEVSAVA